MRKKICIFATLSLTVISLVGCREDDNSYSTTDSSYESSSYENNDLGSDDEPLEASSSYESDSSTPSSSYSSSSKTIEHYCEVDDCYKEGVKTIVGFSGEAEYYCQDHYDEIQNIISDMEEDVGSGSASQHTCEVSGCYKEGTNEITGFSGTSEYYCTEHYNEMMEMLGNMLGND